MDGNGLYRPVVPRQLAHGEEHVGMHVDEQPLQGGANTMQQLLHGDSGCHEIQPLCHHHIP